MTDPNLTTPAADVAATSAQSTAAVDFANDIGPRNIGESFRLYTQRVRGGEVGALPAVAGVVILAIIFYSANSLFLSKSNFANFLTQAAPIAVLAMGSIFVLLMGEIDLSIGTASGVCAATMALGVTRNGDLNAALGTPTYLALLLLLVVAIGITARYRLWIATGVIVLGGIFIVTKLTQHAPAAIFVSIAVGVAIGSLIGFLVAHVGIPSFIVTLALFLAWQGVLLKFIGQGAAISTQRVDLINKIENENLSATTGWVLWVVAVGIYSAYTIGRSLQRRRAKLTGEPIDLVVLRALLIAVVTGIAIYVLNENRGRTVFAKLQGVPYVVPIIFILLVVGTIVLAKTRYGRYVYAVGGNTEAARRAGIDVKRIRLSVFVIASAMAGVAGVIGASRQGGVPSDFGSHTDQLYAVGAAVIGGTSLFGGRGKVRDGVIGALVIAMIPNGLGLKNLGSSYEFMITGLVLLLAASVDAISRRRTATS
ncbi:MAG: D-xylose transport system permease protein [Pseudonocardiales bacterium]|nr:D-xylose transport system permease protein [Pseudonocardiales bacterium]